MSLPEWLLLIAGLLALAVALGTFARRLGVPLTVVLAVVGFLAGGMGRWLGVGSPLEEEAFEQVVIYLFLPLLVFEAALGLSTRAFFRNLGFILVLAVPALVLSAVLVGFALHGVLGVPLAAALLFGILISATDPVAVVVVFRDLGVPQRLLTLVEGESLLNDGVAIVLFNIFLAVALGAPVSVLGGVGSFLSVFFGGLAIGTVIGIGAALFVPHLARLPAAALTVAVAYGGYVLTDYIFGFSGVMATVAAGLVLGGLAPSRAAAPVRELWKELWESLGYVANGILFLLIGLAIDPALVGRFGAVIALAIVVVLAARTIAVVPLIALHERYSSIPRIGRRDQAVLVWGGLRGGVALALALALPEELLQRELFVAMAGGVVLTTLLLNATTIGPLVRRLRLDQPTRTDRFLACGARLSGIANARSRLAELRLEDPLITAALEEAERLAIAELASIELTAEEEFKVVTGRGLFVERDTYQRLTDAGILPSSVARTLLDEVDDQIEEFSLDHPAIESVRAREAPLFDRAWERFTGWLPAGENAAQLAFAEATARRLAARRTSEALSLFDRLPNVRREAVEEAKVTFSRWEEEAIASLTELDERAGELAAHDPGGLRRHQAEALSRVAAEDILEELTDVGLLPKRVARRAARAIAAEVRGGPLDL